MKRFSKVLLSLLTAALILIMVTACATQPAPEVVVEEEPVAVLDEPAPAEEEAVPAVEEPVIEEAEEPAPEEPAAEEEIAEAAEPEVPVLEQEEIYRIIGTNGLLNLALASYEGGMGFAEVSAIVDFAKSGYPTLVLDAGSNAVDVPDLPLGLEEGAALAAVIDEIGYYAMTPGTADLLFGAEALKMLDENTGMSVLSANIRQNGELVFAPSTLVQAGDVTVGIFGLTTPLAAGMGVEVSPTQEDLMAAAEAAVMDLKAQGADYIIALTNMGFEQGGFSAAELDWAAEYVSGYIDLIIDGMGSVPYQEIRGTTMYVQLGGAEYVGGVEITARGGKIVDVETLLITEEMAAGLVPNAAVAGILTETGKRLGAIAASAAKAQAEAAAAKAQAEAEAAAAKAKAQAEAAAAKAKAEAEAAAAKAKAEAEAAAAKAKAEAEAAAAKAQAEAEAAAAKAQAEAEAAAAKAPEEEVEPAAEAEAVADPYYELKAAGAKDRFTLTIVHTNDVHGRLDEDPYGGMGVAKIATVIDYVQQVSEASLILDAGDALHGSNAVTLSEGASMAKLMSGTYDAMVPGNHDFNYGTDRLLELDAMTDFPFLSANVTREGELLFQPYKIFEYYGFKVAVVGLSTPETAYKTHPANVEGVSFTQPPAWALADPRDYGSVSLAETASLVQAGVDLLRQEADMVIVLSHLGLDEESEYTSRLIAENITGIDLIIDGHSHTVLPEGLVVNGTMIAQAGQYGNNVGIVNVEVEKGTTAAITPFLYSMEEAAEIEPHPAVVAYLAEVNAEVDAFTQQEIATLPYTLDGERARVRTRPTNLTKILTTAMMEATGADAALTNGGGVRASIDAGNVTVGEVITVLPFNNTLVVIEVTGAELMAALENGIKDLPNASGAYAQTAGIEAIWNRFNPPGERLFKVKVGGKLIDPDATYRLATNDFLAAGGDEYTMFAEKPLLEEYGLLAEIFGYYLVENFPLEK